MLTDTQLDTYRRDGVIVIENVFDQSILDRLRDVIAEFVAMLAPASASPMAMPKPRPPLPPVTMATLPVKSNSLPDVIRVSWITGVRGS